MSQTGNGQASHPLIRKAQQICLQRRVRLTSQRLKVLSLMVHHEGAISAYDLLALLQASDPGAKPPTIYRALDFLLSQGLIHKVESTNRYIVCHHLEHPLHTSILLICTRCGQVIEKTVEALDPLLQQISAQQHFLLQRSMVEAHGLCTHCQSQT
ncbi:MAG: zinc uptake transcriptional repressor Zur [Enterobacteriaceae bacterium]